MARLLHNNSWYAQFYKKKIFNVLKIIQIQRNVVSGIANIVIVSIMKTSNFLHDVWFDIFFSYRK